MSLVMEEYISNLDLGPVTEFCDVAVIPIFSPLSGPNYLTLKDAMEQGLLIITEIDEDAEVGELRVKNLADIPVLLLDGEEIVGAKQNRVLNTTIMVGAGTEIIAPVSCTERGRWHYKSRRFSDSDVIAARRVRRSKNASVSESLGSTGSFKSNQRDVWNEIDDMSAEACVNSPTSAMEDVYKSRKTQLSEFTKAFPSHENQKGILILINGEVVGFEAVSSEKAYKQLHNKIIKSYALEVILTDNQKQSQEDVMVEARKFLEEARKTSSSQHKSVGTGFEFRFKGKRLIGSSLIVENNIIHTVLFNTKA